MPPDPHDKSYGAILRLALPLILSMSGFMILHFVDAVFLAWYSDQALAAIGPAGLASYMFVSFWQGVAGYAGTLAAQYVGAGRPERVGAAIWQGLYVAVAAGALTAAMAWAGPPLFLAVGHAPAVAAMEGTFFRICCWGSLPVILISALAGLFTATERTRVLMLVQGIGFVWNLAADWLLIFGHGGFPRLGIAGAALATVSAQTLGAILLLGLVFRRRERRGYAMGRGWRFDAPMMGRLLRFGVPSGGRVAIEMVGWTAFLLFVGRIGTLELAATNLVWRINGIAFFPLIGIAQAVAVYVGQSQGRERPDLSRRIAWRGLALCEVWMVACAALFVFAPQPLIRLFLDPAGMSPPERATLLATSVRLLRFVAAYCVCDAGNLILISALQAAGDTRWTLAAHVVGYGIFIGALVALDRAHAGLAAEWWLMTACVVGLALVWFVRFESGRWRRIRVIEVAVA